jgi:hypothetical protein
MGVFDRMRMIRLDIVNDGVFDNKFNVNYNIFID